MVVEYEKRAAFSCLHVGAYCIRPTGDPFMGRMIQMIDHRCAFLSPAGPFGGAYAIRPYPDGRKMIAVGVYHWVRYEKRGAMPAFYRQTWRRLYACDLFYLGVWGLARLVDLSNDGISGSLTAISVIIPNQFPI